MSAPHRRPVWLDALDAQMETWRWQRSRPGRDWFASQWERLTSNDPVLRDADLDWETMHQDIMLKASPFFITRDMLELTQIAVETWKPEPLLASDFLCHFGFLYFEEPIRALYQNEQTGKESEAPVNGFAWGMPAAQNGAIAIIMTPWLHEWGTSTVHVPRCMPVPLGTWGFEIDTTAASETVGLIHPLLRLMLQFVPKSRYSVAPDAASRRLAKKLEFPERDVVVVRLRREAAKSEPSGASANYSHRFIRSGHWRNQWYPSLRIHRQKWIFPTVVGDRSLPLRVKRRVFVFDR